MAIVVLRGAFNWGTQRIKLNLERPPSYIPTLLESTTGKEWKHIILSRQAINNVLKKHYLNVNPYKSKRDWNYFRASKPDELWQIDIRGPIRIAKIRGYVLVILDDYSRYLVWCKFHERITIKIVPSALSYLAITRKRKPQKILADNGSQFKISFENRCNNLGIEVSSKIYYLLNL